MSDDFVDPGEPGELHGLMKAKDLLNKPCLIRPNKIAQAMGKDNDGNPQPYDYFPCDVWVLDRQGVVEQGTGVRISWVRVMPQLADRIGQFVAATPRRQDDNSVVLQAFSEAGKEIARVAIKEIQETAPATSNEPEPQWDDDGQEPF